ncbi:MAG: ABC transporter permease [Bacteroidota bacterium]
MKRQPLIPRLGAWLIERLLPNHQSDLVQGDFEEYLESLTHDGKAGYAIQISFWTQFALSLPSLISQSFAHRTSFVTHSVLLAFRNIKRHKMAYAINLLGLSIGLAAFLAIMFYVHDERSYDQFHAKSDRIYRVLDFRKVDGSGEESSSAPTPLAVSMVNEYPLEVEQVVRFFNFQAPTMALASTNADATSDGKRFNEAGVYFVDSTFFNVFDFKLVAGNAQSALTGPDKIVLTRHMAQKYFGDSDPMGKTLELEGKHNLVVSGILEASAGPSHLQFDFLISFQTLDDPELLSPRLHETWIWNPSWTYVLLSSGVNAKAFEEGLQDFVQKYFPESRRNRVKLHLQPLEDIHLYSDLDYEMHPNGNAELVQTFFWVGIFILIISYINFINLSIARAISRQREIGLRKVLGGNNKQVFWHLVYESIIVNFLGLLMSVPLLYLVVEMINRMEGVNILLTPDGLPWSPWEFLGAFFVVGVLSGVYPALLLSGFNPNKVFKDAVVQEKKIVGLSRKLLVMGQFVISISLMSATLVAVDQLNYLKDRSVGFEAEDVILIPSLRTPILPKYESFKAQVLALPGVESVTTVEDVPGVKHQTGSYQVHSENETLQFARLVVHDDFTTTLGIPMAAGRDYLATFQADDNESVIINASMAKLLGFTPTEAIGKPFNNDMIVGVTEDYHFTSMRKPVGPFILERVGNSARSLAFSARYIAVKIDPRYQMQVASHIEEVWQSIAPNAPFEFQVLGDLLQEQYQAENTLGSLSSLFTILSVVIACLGLYGLSAFMTGRRIKEIGIRKVLGARVRSLLVLLTSSYVRMIIVAIAISAPLAYWLLERWLQGFAYHIDLQVWPFLTASVITVGIVLMTVSFHAFKSSIMNPVETLRNE